MTQPQRHSNPVNATVLLDRARELEPLLRVQGPLSESRGKLTDEAFGAMRDAGLLK
jgi:hypothetical protein